jgi:hypothetical protein
LTTNVSHKHRMKQEQHTQSYSLKIKVSSHLDRMSQDNLLPSNLQVVRYWTAPSITTNIRLCLLLQACAAKIYRCRNRQVIHIKIVTKKQSLQLNIDSTIKIKVQKEGGFLDSRLMKNINKNRNLASKIPAIQFRKKVFKEITTNKPTWLVLDIKTTIYHQWICKNKNHLIQVLSHNSQRCHWQVIPRSSVYF